MVWVCLQPGATQVLREYWVQLASVAIFALLCCFMLKGKQVIGVVLAGAIAGMLLTTVHTQYIARPVAALSGKTLTVTATVRDYAQVYEENQRVALAFPASEVGITTPHPKIKTLAYVPLTNEPLLPGDQITATLSFYIPTVLDGFARKEYYEANGFYILASAAEEDELITPEFTVTPATRVPLSTRPARLAHAIKAQLSALFPPREAGFLHAILLGDKSDLLSSDQRAMKKAGLSHAMAVSGMHIGFLVGFFFLLFGRKYGGILSIAAILIFMPMAGTSPSVLRAGIMYLMTAIGFCLGRESDSLNALSLALLILLAVNPYAIGSVSLQLSFAASLGLILFSGRLKRWLMRPLSGLPRIARRIASVAADGLSCSICALCFTAPILFSAFGYVSVLSLLSNVLTIGALSFVFTLGLFTGVVSMAVPVAGTLLAKPLTLAMQYILGVAHKISALPLGVVYWKDVYGRFALLLCFVTLLLIAFPPKKCKLRYLLPPVCMAVLVLTGISIYRGTQEMTVSFLPSGSGQTIMVANGRRDDPVVIDCGASGHRDATENIIAWMDWRCYEEIDTLILTGVDMTHARGVPALLENVPVRQILIPENVRESEIFTQIQEAAQAHYVPIAVWHHETAGLLHPDDNRYGVSISSAVDRKLVVHIESGDILILHSLTQKMLQQLLQEHPIQAKTIVLSESNLSDAEMVYDAIDRLDTETIILQSGYSMLEKLRRKPVRNTMLEGEIELTLPLPDGKG